MRKKICSNCQHDPKIQDYNKKCNHPDGVPEDNKRGVCKGWKGFSYNTNEFPYTPYKIIEQ